MNPDQRRRAEIGFCLGLKYFCINMIVLHVEWLVYMTLFLMIMIIFTVCDDLFVLRKKRSQDHLPKDSSMAHKFLILLKKLLILIRSIMILSGKIQ